MMSTDQHVGARWRARTTRPLGRGLPPAVLAVSLVLAGCGADMGAGTTPTTVEVTVTETVQDESMPPEPTGDVQPTPTDEPAPEPAEVDDEEWFMEADYACGLAIEEYEMWKAQAGDGAPSEALALGAASAATRASDTIDSMPDPLSADALELRDAVAEWAASYRDLSVAMDGGTYTEVMSSGDAAIAAADRVRNSSWNAPACADMVDDV